MSQITLQTSNQTNWTSVRETLENLDHSSAIQTADSRHLSFQLKSGDSISFDLKRPLCETELSTLSKIVSNNDSGYLPARYIADKLSKTLDRMGAEKVESVPQIIAAPTLSQAESAPVLLSASSFSTIAEKVASKAVTAIGESQERENQQIAKGVQALSSGWNKFTKVVGNLTNAATNRLSAARDGVEGIVQAAVSGVASRLPGVQQSLSRAVVLLATVSMVVSPLISQRVQAQSPDYKPIPLTPQKDLPFGTLIEGRPGFVNSPYAAKHQLVDVTGLPPGQSVQCPYTGKEFRVPDPKKPAGAPVSVAPTSPTSGATSTSSKVGSSAPAPAPSTSPAPSLSSPRFTPPPVPKKLARPVPAIPATQYTAPSQSQSVTPPPSTPRIIQPAPSSSSSSTVASTSVQAEKISYTHNEVKRFAYRAVGNYERNYYKADAFSRKHFGVGIEELSKSPSDSISIDAHWKPLFDRVLPSVGLRSTSTIQEESAKVLEDIKSTAAASASSAAPTAAVTTPSPVTSSPAPVMTPSPAPANTNTPAATPRSTTESTSPAATASTVNGTDTASATASSSKVSKTTRDSLPDLDPALQEVTANQLRLFLLRITDCNKVNASTAPAYKFAAEIGITAEEFQGLINDRAAKVEVSSGIFSIIQKMEKERIFQAKRLQALFDELDAQKVNWKKIAAASLTTNSNLSSLRQSTAPIQKAARSAGSVAPAKSTGSGIFEMNVAMGEKTVWDKLFRRQPKEVYGMSIVSGAQTYSASMEKRAGQAPKRWRVKGDPVAKQALLDTVVLTSGAE